MKVKYGIRWHRSTLEESLKTKKYIEKKDFINNFDDYEYYGYDIRCNQTLFILKNQEEHENRYMPTWLFIEEVKSSK